MTLWPNSEELLDPVALVVGIGSYVSSEFSDLPATVRDAQALAAQLTDPESCRYPLQNIRLLTGPDASLQGLRAAFSWLVGRSTIESTVFIYFSGHGGRILRDGQWRVYLCPRDASFVDLERTAFSSETLREYLEELQYRKLIVVLDSCHSGGVGRSKLQLAGGWRAGTGDQFARVMARGSGRVVIASSKENQLSWNLDDNSHGLFTACLLSGLGGQAAVRGDGAVRIFDLFYYVAQHVSGARSDQEPVLHASDVDDNFTVAFARDGLMTNANASLEAIRARIVLDPIQGARELAAYLVNAGRSDLATSVDVKRAELAAVKHDSGLFGSTENTRAIQNRAIYFLLRLCLDFSKSLRP